MKKSTQIIDLGITDYLDTWRYQRQLFDGIVQIKKEQRKRPVNQYSVTPNYLIFCEHHHVFTLGKNGNERNLLIDKHKLHTINASFYHTERGGDITYHGPGQIVVYPIIDLENFKPDIRLYMRLLETAAIHTLNDFNISGERIKGMTGVWIDSNDVMKTRKICAMGVKMSRWVTLHGMALNVNVNLAYFNYILPCGITQKTVTSMEKEKGKKQCMNDIKATLLSHIVELFGMSVIK